jgi:tetratricopeptide (TPR) repeat protein
MLQTLSLVVSLILQAAPATQPQPLSPAERRARLAEASAAQTSAEELGDAGKLQEAKVQAERAVQLREQILGRQSLTTAVSLQELGVILIRLGEYQAAEPLLTRALAARRRLLAPSDRLVAESLDALARVYQMLRRFDEAEPLLTRALKIRESIRPRDPAALAAAHNSLGSLLRTRGDFDHALQHARTALELTERSPGASPRAIGTLYHQLATIEFEQDRGDLAAAQRDYERAREIREKIGENAQLALTLNGLASALQEQGKVGEAEPLYQRALGIYEHTLGPASPEYGQALNNLAVVYLLGHDYAKAGPLYERALAIREAALGPYHPDVAQSLAAYAIFLAKTGRTSEAIAVQARHTDIIERTLAQVLETGSEPQKRRYLETLTDSVQITLWMRSALAPNDAAAERLALTTVMRNKGRLLDAVAGASSALRHTLGPRQKTEIDALAKLRADLGRVFLEAPSQVSEASRQERIKKLTDEIDALEGTLIGRPRREASAAGVTIEAIQQALEPGSVLVDFFRYRPFDPDKAERATRFGEPRYVAYALRRDGAPRWLELGDAAPIDRAIAGYRAALTDSASDPAPAAGLLWTFVTRPLLALAGDDRAIVVSPEGQLNLLPFAALTDDRQHYLVERYTFTYATSARELVGRSADRVATTPPLVVANPAFGPTTGGAGLSVGGMFEPLRGAEQEALDIKQLLPQARIVRGPQATERMLKDVRSPLILHIATHGFFLDDGDAPLDGSARGLRRQAPAPGPASVPALLRSGLALAGANRGTGPDGEDGILTAIEAAGLNLDGTELVFLSACDTGRGVIAAGDSVYGLRRALVVAGARAQVVTLWQVNDAATRLFVGRFYERLLQHDGRSQSLRAAQLEMLKDPTTAHPFYWAAFLASGDGRPIDVAGVK